MKTSRFLRVAIFLVLTALAQGLITNAGVAQDPESIKSSPKDTTPYTRPAVPEDFAPALTGALPGAPLIVDVVVNNIDPNLSNTDTFNDGETSIAVSPANPNEIVITNFVGS